MAELSMGRCWAKHEWGLGVGLRMSGGYVDAGLLKHYHKVMGAVTRDAVESRGPGITRRA